MKAPRVSSNPLASNLNKCEYPDSVSLEATWARFLTLPQKVVSGPRHPRSTPSSPQQTYLYCAADGDGKFIVRGFGPRQFQMNGREGADNAAVHKAAGVGQPVTQQIALSVKGGRVECAINGTVVAGYDKADLVTAGKLKSTDGVYGIRFAHNTDALVTGLAVTKP